MYLHGAAFCHLRRAQHKRHASLLRPGSPAVDLNLYTPQHQTLCKLKSQHLSFKREFDTCCAPLLFFPFSSSISAPSSPYLNLPFAYTNPLNLFCNPHANLKSHNFMPRCRYTLLVQAPHLTLYPVLGSSLVPRPASRQASLGLYLP